jgi:hypothetical protein
VDFMDYLHINANKTKNSYITYNLKIVGNFMEESDRKLCPEITGYKLVDESNRPRRQERRLQQGCQMVYLHTKHPKFGKIL